MSTEIISPPFPPDTTTIPRLLQHLKALREWVLDMRFWANDTTRGRGYDGEIVPEQIIEIPTEDRYRGIAIVDIMRVYAGMRSIRESWDAMVRIHEETWDEQSAVVWRLHLIHAAYLLLSDAFVDPETREARIDAARRKHQKMAHKMMRRMGFPKEMLGPSANMVMGEDGPTFVTEQDGYKQIDFDALFHGEDSSDDDGDDDGEDSFDSMMD